MSSFGNGNRRSDGYVEITDDETELSSEDFLSSLATGYGITEVTGQGASVGVAKLANLLFSDK